mgnify:CR=1 FL=1
MKDWGLSFQNKRSAKIFYQILKEGVIRETSDSSSKEDLLGKRSDMWSDEEPEPQGSDEGGALYNNLGSSGNLI